MAVGTTNYPTSLDTVVELVEAANNAADTLSAGISAGDASLTLADAAEFAASGIVAIENELLSYTGKSGSTLTGLTRGIEGTTAASHSSGADVRQVITAASHNVQSAAIIALEQKLGTGTDIAWSQMSPLTANRLVVTDGAGDVTASPLTHDATNAVIGNIGGLDFDTTPTATPTTARMVWDDTHGTVNLTLKGGTVGVDIGQTTVARVVNKTVTNINLLRSNYQVVRIISAQGQRLAISLAQGDAEPNSTDVIGLVAEDIANNQEGFIVARGLITEINTTGSLQGETWADGDILYLSPTTAGGLTKVEPQAPDHLIIVGYVVYAHSQHGKIYVAIQTSWETKELHDVKITGTPVAGSLLIRNATTGVWENATLTAGSNISITNADKSITIAGTGGVASVTGTSPVVSSGGSTPAISLAANYGDTQNPYASKTANNFLAAPNGTAGAPTFRAIVAADIPTLNQNTTGTASNVTGTVAIANGGTGATTAPNALTNLGAYPASNPNGYTSNTGTVTSVGGTGTVNGITLTGSVSTTGNLTLGGTLSGVSLTTQVTGTLPIANGGTGQTTQQAALNALAGAATSGQYLRGNGTNVVMSAIQAGDVPTLNQNTTGTAANVTGVVAIANGGTGQTTRQDAMDALAGAVTAGQYLRGNGTDVVMSAIQVADVPTLNQNTTGTASNVTGTVAIANGGTGATTAGAARTNLGATTVGSNLFTLTNPSAVTFPRFNADNTVSALTDTAFRTAIGAGTVTGVTASSPLSSSGGATPNLSLGTVPVANGGTGVTTVSSGQLLIGTSAGGFAASTLTAGSNVTITNGSGTITIAASSGATPGGSDTQVQFNDGGSFGGDAGLTYDKTTDALTVVGPTQMSELRLKESAGGSDYVGFKAPALVTSNQIWTLPDGDGNDGQVLATNGVGTLQWRNGRDVLTADRTYYVGFDLGSVTANATTDKIEKTAHGLENGDPVVFNAATAPAGIILGATYYVINKATNDFEIALTAGGTKITWTSNGTTVTCRTGNDNNAGFAYTNYGNNTQAANSRTIALLTIQKAIDLVAGIDLSSYSVTIKLANGRYLETIRPKTYTGAGPVVIEGDPTTPSNVTLQPYSVGEVSFTAGTTDTVNKTAHGLFNGTPVQFLTYGTAPGGVTMEQVYYVINAAANTFQISTTVNGSAVDITSTGSTVAGTQYQSGIVMKMTGVKTKYVLRGVRVGSNAGVPGLRINNSLLDIEKCDFAGSSALTHVWSEYQAAVTFPVGTTWSMSAGASYGLIASDQAFITTRQTSATMTNTPTFTAFALGDRIGFLLLDLTTYSGASSGSSWLIRNYSVLQYSTTAGSIAGSGSGTVGTEVYGGVTIPHGRVVISG